MKTAIGVASIAALGGLTWVALAGGDECAHQAPQAKEPIAEGVFCNLGAFSPAERQRHHELGKKLKAAVVDMREQEMGYAFKVDPSQASVMELAEWIDGERKCCPFFDLQIELEPNGAGNWLKLSGRARVKAFIRDELIGAGKTAKPAEATHADLQPWDPIDEGFRGCEEGCGKRGPNPQARIQPGAKPGQLAYCPVSGVAFQVKPESPHAELDGKPVYFCCEGCKKHFLVAKDEVIAKRKLAVAPAPPR